MSELDPTILDFLNSKELETHRTLRKSSFGTILSIKKFNNNVLFAAKITKYLKNRERTIWPRLLHPNILPVFEVFEISMQYTIYFMPLCKINFAELLQGSSLTRKGHAIDIIIEWMFQILCGVNYLHCQKIAHLDLKLDNILLTCRDKALVSDFTYVTDEDDVTEEFVSGMPYKWKPPELWECSTHVALSPTRMDLWCYGMIVLESVTRFALLRYLRCRMCNLESSKNFILEFIGSLQDINFLKKTVCGAFPSSEIHENFILNVLAFLNLFLQTDPEKRVSAKQALCHEVLIPFNSFFRA